MGEENNNPPGLATLLSRVGQTSLGVLRNRAELLTLEWQEERARLTRLLVWSLSLLFLGLMAVGFIAATIVVLVPQEYRVWVLAAFAVLFAAAAFWAFFIIKSLLKKEPFADSIEQLRKDVSLLEGRE